MKFRNKIGQAIKDKRIELGLTQVQLAEQCGILDKTISKIENGKFSQSADLIEKICNVLNLKIELK